MVFYSRIVISFHSIKKEIIDKATYKNIKPVGSRPGVLYRLGKVHKQAKNRLSPFRPILSTIGTPTYKLAIYLLQFFIPLTQNEYTVTDSFHFAQENICVDNVYKDDENSSKIPKDVFCNLVTVVTSESFFMFTSKFYKQIDGVAMGSPLGPALANIFMCSFENKWLKDCPHSLKSVLYRRCVDDIFVMFSSLDQAEKFKTYLSFKHSNIKFLF